MTFYFSTAVLPTTHFEERPPSTIIDTVVIHSMHQPGAVEPCDARGCRDLLDNLGFSAHYYIDREGIVWRSVAEQQKAWHAGPSAMPFPDDERSQVNDFSIGIELLATFTSGYTDPQYKSLALLIADISTRFPLKNIVGHEHISLGRKTDPWRFDWKRFEEERLPLMDKQATLRVPLESTLK